MTIGELIGSPKKGHYKPDEFSHKDLLAITGLTPETLFTWYKRGHLAEAFHGTKGLAAFKRNPKPGRGNRRRYCFLEVFIVAAINQLAALGLPLVAAVRNAKWIFLSIGDLEELHDIGISPAVKTLRTKPKVWAIWRADKLKMPAMRHEAGYSWGALEPADTVQGIHEWLTFDGPPAFRFVDETALLYRLIRRTARLRLGEDWSTK